MAVYYTDHASCSHHWRHFATVAYWLMQSNRLDLFWFGYHSQHQKQDVVDKQLEPQLIKPPWKCGKLKKKRRRNLVIYLHMSYNQLAKENHIGQERNICTFVGL